MNFNKITEKKTRKKENILLSFTMKAISRDQEKNFLISRLQKEIKKNLEKVRLLQVENEIKENLLNLKDKELESLTTENKKLQKLLEYKKEKVVNTAIKNKALMIMNDSHYNNEFSENPNNLGTVSAKNIFISKSNSVISSSATSPTESLSSKISKKCSFQREKETNVTRFIYNFRKRNK